MIYENDIIIDKDKNKYLVGEIDKYYNVTYLYALFDDTGCSDTTIKLSQLKNYKKIDYSK